MKILFAISPLYNKLNELTIFVYSYFEKGCRKKCTFYRSQLFAESTKATYKTHRNVYLRFCHYMGYTPVPVHPPYLLQYAAVLARSLKPSSIRTYLNIIGILHKEFWLPPPLLNNWPFKSLLIGIKRAVGTPPNQKLPITAEMLLQIHTTLR